MLLGVLDIGSNSAQPQVFEVRPGAPPLAAHAVKRPAVPGEVFDVPLRPLTVSGHHDCARC
jgi:hypothetical protein